MKQFAVTAVAVLALVAGFVAFVAFFSWAPGWAWQLAVGIGVATFVTEQWRRRLRPRAFLSQETRRVVVACALLVAVAAVMGWATGVWAAGGFVAAITVGSVRQRRRSAV